MDTKLATKHPTIDNDTNKLPTDHVTNLSGTNTGDQTAGTGLTLSGGEFSVDEPVWTCTSFIFLSRQIFSQ